VLKIIENKYQNIWSRHIYFVYLLCSLERGRETTPTTLNLKIVNIMSQGFVTVKMVDRQNGKNRSKRYSQDFETIATFQDTEHFKKWMNVEYPNSVRHTGRETLEKFGDNWVYDYKYLFLHIRDLYTNGWNETYIIPNK